MSSVVHRLVIPIVFADGISPGAGREGNRSILSYSGCGNPVLRGTSIAGTLRHAWERANPGSESSKWFGSPAGSHARESSAIRVLDAILAAPVEQRMHNSIDRHRGKVRERALFSVSSLSAGVRTNLVMYLTSDASGLVVDQVRDFINQIVSIVADGLQFGGSAARGVGRASLISDSKPKLRKFDLSDLEQHGQWLDELRQLAEKTPDSGDPITPQPLDSNRLQVSFKFAIAPGQDVLVGGLNLDGVLEQQQCTAADGTEYFRIPGSSMKGIFRSWFSRLAARDSLPVADNLERLDRTLPHESDKAADPGWGFVDETTRQKWISDPSLVACPIMNLFGSLYAKGRFRCSDSRMKKGERTSSPRTHVSIDRISGGASEGFLFESRVLAESPAPFEFTVTIDEPTEREARWLHATLKAIDLGVLRVGATKAAGRVQLASAVNAVGPHAQMFAELAATGGIK